MTAIDDAAPILKAAMREYRDAGIEYAMNPTSTDALRRMQRAAKKMLVAEIAMSDAEILEMTGMVGG